MNTKEFIDTINDEFDIETLELMKQFIDERLTLLLVVMFFNLNEFIGKLILKSFKVSPKRASILIKKNGTLLIEFPNSWAISLAQSSMFMDS